MRNSSKTCIRELVSLYCGVGCVGASLNFIIDTPNVKKKMSILIKKITVHPRHLPHPFLVFSSPRTHKSLGEFLECGFVSHRERQFCIAVAFQAVWRFFILREGKTMMPFVYFFPEGDLTGLLVRGPLAVITLYHGTLSADDGMRC